MFNENILDNIPWPWHKPKMPKDKYNHQSLLHPVSDLVLLSTPEHRPGPGRKSITPQPPHRNSSRASSHGSRKSQDPPLDQFKENSLNVYLHDVQHLVRKGIVGLPGMLHYRSLYLSFKGIFMKFHLIVKRTFCSLST